MADGVLKKGVDSGALTKDKRYRWLQRELVRFDYLSLNKPDKGIVIRCQAWRAKRRLVDPSSREAALLTRRAHSARGEAK